MKILGMIILLSLSFAERYVFATRLPSGSLIVAGADAIIDHFDQEWEQTLSYIVEFREVTVPLPEGYKIGTSEEPKKSAISPKKQARLPQNISIPTADMTDDLYGRLLVKKPDQIRWQFFKEPVGKTNNPPTVISTEIISKSKYIYIHYNHYRKNRTVQILTLDDSARARLALKAIYFLTGKAKLKELYRVTPLEMTKNNLKVKLVPKKPPVNEIYLATISNQDLFITELSVLSQSEHTQTTIYFGKMQRNPTSQLKDDMFEYIPQPKDIVYKEK